MRQQDVAVGDDDPAVAGGAPALADVVELGVVGDAIIADQQARLHMRMLGDHALGKGDHGIGGRGAAQQDLELRIVQLEGRAQRRLLEGVEPAQRPDDGDGRLLGCRAAELDGAAAAPGGGQRRGDMDEQGSHRERAGQLRQQLHAPPRVATACLSGLTGRLVFRLCDKAVERRLQAGLRAATWRRAERLRLFPPVIPA